MKKMLFALFVFVSFSFNVFAAVNLNTATQAELETIDGIGPVKAQAILDYRKKNGGFKTVDELEKVDGIGAVTLKNVRKDVSITGKTTVVTPADAKPAKEAKTAKTEKATKETKAKDVTKAVGTVKAATSGKTADAKNVKEEKSTKVESTKTQ